MCGKSAGRPKIMQRLSWRQASMFNKGMRTYAGFVGLLCFMVGPLSMADSPPNIQTPSLAQNLSQNQSQRPSWQDRRRPESRNQRRPRSDQPASANGIRQQSSVRKPAQAAAPKLNPKEYQKGRVVTPSATVYGTPDFDGEVIGRVKAGSNWVISRKVYGAFYQVRLPGNRVGYVTDADIRPLSLLPKANAPAGARAAKPNEPASEASQAPEEGARIAADRGSKVRKTFDEQDFQGVSLLGLRYRESTMGLTPTDNMMLIGFKSTGADNLAEGLPTELNIQFSPSAPKYYEQATGRSSEGFLFLLDAMAISPSLHGPDTMTFFGFGPMFRFSKYGVTLPVGGKDEFYSLEDMTIGMKFNYGISRRFGSSALRLDFQYYWEKTQYYGLSLAFQFSR